MKVRNILRMQVVVIGFGAALLLASSAPAQEIVNTEFNDGPNVASFDQPAAKNVEVGTSTDSKMAQTSGVTEVVSTPVVSNGEMVSLEHSAERWLIGASLFGLAMLAVFAGAEVRRANRNIGMRTSASLYPRATIS
jgi:hypothetical protein